MNKNPQIIKKIEPVNCPHCKKEFYISSQSMMPTLTETTTIEEIERTKEKVREGLGQIAFHNDGEKSQILEWLNNENTLLDASDIEPILKQIGREQVEAIQANKK